MSEDQTPERLFRGITLTGFEIFSRDRERYRDSNRYTTNWPQAFSHAIKYAVEHGTKAVVIVLNDPSKYQIKKISGTEDTKDFLVLDPINLNDPDTQVLIEGKNLDDLCDYSFGGVKMNRDQVQKFIAEVRERWE